MRSRRRSGTPGAHRPPAGAAGGAIAGADTLAGAAAPGGADQRVPGRPLHAAGADRAGGDGPRLPGPRHPAQPPGGAEDPGAGADQQSAGRGAIPARGAGRCPVAAREPRAGLRLRRVQRPLFPRDGVHRGPDDRQPPLRAGADAAGDGGPAGPAGGPGAGPCPPQGPDPPRRQPVQHHGDPRRESPSWPTWGWRSTCPTAIASRARGRPSARSTTWPPSRRGIPTRPTSAATSIRWAARLYHMLSGQVPFPSPSLPEKLFAHQAMEPTPLEQIVPGLPAGLADVVRTMMRKQPDERYGTPAQVVQALEPYIDEGPAAIRVEIGAVAVRAATSARLRRGPDVPRRPRTARRTPRLRHPGSETDAASPAAGLLVADSPRTDADPRRWRDAERTGPGIRPAGRDRRPIAARARRSRPRSPAPPRPSAPTSTTRPSPCSPRRTTSPTRVPGCRSSLDLGPEPPLRSPSARPPWSRRTATPRPGSRPRRETVLAAKRLAPIRAGHRPPAGCAWSLAAIILTAAILASPRVLRSARLVRRTALIAGRFVPRRSPGSSSNRASPSRPQEGAGHRRPLPWPRGRWREREIRRDPEGGGEGRRGGRKGRLSSSCGIDEPLVLEPDEFFDLASGTGRLEIRAAPGTRPVIEVPMGTAQPFLTTGLAVSVKLSGLTIRARYAAPAKEAVSSSDPAAGDPGRRPCRDRSACAFEVVGRRAQRWLPSVVHGRRQPELDRCWFQGFDAAIRHPGLWIDRHPDQPDDDRARARARARATSTPELRGWALGIESPAARSREPKRKLTLDHCTIEGAGFLDSHRRRGQGPHSRWTSSSAPCGPKPCWPGSPPSPAIASTSMSDGRALGNQLQVLAGNPGSCCRPRR